MKLNLTITNSKLSRQLNSLLTNLNLKQTKAKDSDFIIIDNNHDNKTLKKLLNLKKPILRLCRKGSVFKQLSFDFPEFYIYQRFYDDDNLIFILKEFIDHIEFLKRKNGYLIVIDGGDGAGKKTQSDLLVKHFKNKGKKVKLYDFPQYFGSIYGQTIARFLNKEFGPLNQVAPELISVLYAQDRQTVVSEMKKLLTEGAIIICNRYTSSNLAFQTVRKPAALQMKFINWIIDLEYKTNLLPLEDITIYLDVDTQTAQKLIQKKQKREYLQKQGKDLTEELITYQQQTRVMYLKLTKLFNHWQTINCISNNKLKSIVEIHKDIVSCIEKNMKSA
ncbi:MAG: hypothetical protein KatS3mg090_0466 [Patescibacteria group bacterium]|nr:MAG: hypothetical protein KatS3mg090_0466 [Patescibacteria group bacterium]